MKNTHPPPKNTTCNSLIKVQMYWYMNKLVLTVEPVLRPPLTYINVVSQDRQSWVTGSITCRMFSQAWNTHGNPTIPSSRWSTVTGILSGQQHYNELLRHMCSYGCTNIQQLGLVTSYVLHLVWRKPTHALASWGGTLSGARNSSMLLSGTQPHLAKGKAAIEQHSVEGRAGRRIQCATPTSPVGPWAEHPQGAQTRAPIEHRCIRFCIG